MDSGKCFVPISHGTYESVGPLFVKLIGSFSNDDGDGDGNENVKTAIGFLGKTTTLHVQHAFLTRQDKTFIIVTLQVQLYGTQLARKR